MKLLADTHAYLWWLSGDRRLSLRARDAMSDPGSVVFVSAASIWEVAIKSTLGRIDLDGVDLVGEITNSGFEELSISGRHAHEAGALPPHHQDPFDRMLVAQAKVEGLTCVTPDPMFASYEVATFW